MGLLNPGERQKVIDLWCKLPRIGEDSHVRRLLVETLPNDLQGNIVYVNALRPDIASIVDTVSSDAWSQLRDGSYSILVVMENAINMARGSNLELELYKQMNSLRMQFGLPPVEIPVPELPQPPADQLMQKLYDLIQQMSALKTELDSIYETFGRYILKQECNIAHARLTKACTPLREFTTILEESTDLKVKVHRGLLTSVLLGFNNQAKAVEKRISQFCGKYGAEIKTNQPVDAREDIQQQLDILRGYHESVLKTAKQLYEELCKW